MHPTISKQISDTQTLAAHLINRFDHPILWLPVTTELAVGQRCQLKLVVANDDPIDCQVEVVIVIHPPGAQCTWIAVGFWQTDERDAEQHIINLTHEHSILYGTILDSIIG